MNKELETYLTNMTIDQLMNSPVGNKIEYAMRIFEKVQMNVYALLEKEGEEGTTTVKAVTVMTFSLLNKIVAGKNPLELTTEDWKDIANDVSEYAVLPSGEEYTKFIFSKYEEYIRFSAGKISLYASEKTVAAIRGLADELTEKRVAFEETKINEVTYIEDCLWICLEAMIKLIASTASKVAPEEYADFAQALAAYAFEYGRYVLYSREQAIIAELVESQHKLDEVLQLKYEHFIEDLQQQTKRFYVLIDNAFAPDFRESFLNSIKLAKAAGVAEEEILTTTEDVDVFFLD